MKVETYIVARIISYPKPTPGKTNLPLEHIIINKIPTVGTYSDENSLLMYDVSRQVFPVRTLPTSIHLIAFFGELSVINKL